VAFVIAFFRLRVSWSILGLPLLWLFVASINLAIGFVRFETFISHAVDAAPRKGDKQSRRDPVPSGYAT